MSRERRTEEPARPALTLVSHALCPYVQRAAIVLAEKGVPFVRRDVDLAAKPAWFLAVSPLGKTPVLLVGEDPIVPIFESAVICEYLDETLAPRWLPADALQRAQHRSHVEFASAVLASIAGFYNAADEAALEARRVELVRRFASLESALAALDPAGADGGERGAGPTFDDGPFGLVDAAFAPVFRYFDTFERVRDFGFFTATPRVRRWRAALAARPSVRSAVAADYPRRLAAFLAARPSATVAGWGSLLADGTHGDAYC